MGYCSSALRKAVITDAGTLPQSLMVNRFSGSKVPSRSRGTSISTGPTTVCTVLDRVPLREVVPVAAGDLVFVIAQVLAHLRLSPASITSGSTRIAPSAPAPPTVRQAAVVHDPCFPTNQTGSVCQARSVTPFV